MTEPVRQHRWNNCHGDDGRLRPKAGFRTHLVRPGALVEADAEAADGAGEIQPAGDLRGCGGVGVQGVCRDRDRLGHDAEVEGAPAEDDGDDGEVALQRLAHEHEGRDHDRERQVRHPQTAFWFEEALVSVDVAAGDPVVDVVAERFAEEDAADGDEV